MVRFVRHIMLLYLSQLQTQSQFHHQLDHPCPQLNSSAGFFGEPPTLQFSLYVMDVN